MRPLRAGVARVAAATLASGVAVGIALAVGVATGSPGQSSSMRPPAHKASSLAPAVPSALANSYKFLTQTSSSAMPSSLARDVGWAATAGVNAALAREAGVVGNQDLYLVPGASDTCLELSTGGGSCGTNAVVAEQGAWLILKPVSGAAPTEYGIVPDGSTVTPATASTHVSQSGNAIMATSSTSTAGELTIHTASGQTVDIAVPAGTGKPQETPSSGS